MNYETSREIEVAVADHFGVQTHTIVPNVSWGLFGYELDLCVLNHRSFYASEVEIKISKGDLKRDGKKHHQHDRNGNAIRFLWFAMPEKLSGCEDLVPEHAGIMLIGKDGRVKIVRKPMGNRAAIKWEPYQAYLLARLGTMRTWTLKRAINRRIEESK